MSISDQPTMGVAEFIARVMEPAMAQLADAALNSHRSDAPPASLSLGAALRIRLPAGQQTAANDDLPMRENRAQSVFYEVLFNSIRRTAADRAERVSKHRVDPATISMVAAHRRKRRRCAAEHDRAFEEWYTSGCP